MTHEFHPVAEIFPLMTGAPFDELVADIKANGLREAIWTHEGKIIDGRNRYLACDRAGVDPTFHEWGGDGDLIKFVISLNLHRRHLNESQRSMVAARIAKAQRGGDPANRSKELLTQQQAASLLNVSVPSVKRAKAVQDKGVPELSEAVDRGEASVTSAERITKLSPNEQRSLATKGRAAVARAAQHPPRKRGEVGIVKTRSLVGGKKAPEAIRGAIGTLIGLASGLDHFKVEDVAPSQEETDEWERELATVISAINRFRRKLKEHVNV